MHSGLKILLALIWAVIPFSGISASGFPFSSTPRGELISFTLSGSRIYPGTVRTISVYVPREYRGDKEACSVVRLDGFNTSMMLILDDLIRERSVPIAIGIGISPGTISGSGEEILKYNRSNEFDRMTGKLAEFIEKEVIPAVEARKTKDGKRIRISRKPGDRMITGGSSGGMAAFNAAWQRPDLYGRVFSVIGSFVPMRGGDGFPALVRKTEPKPLRIFLQDNYSDSWNEVFGSWYEYNKLMASALNYAGYDASFRWGEGGHSGGNALAAAKDVMRYLWKGWPAPVEVREGKNELINSLIVPGESWTRCDRMGAAPATEAVYPGGAFVARPKPHTNCIRTAMLDDKGGEHNEDDFYWLHQEGGEDEALRHLAFDTEGWLYASSALGIQICDQNGRVRAILNVPPGRLESFSFAGNTLFVKVDGKCYSRIISHTAATKESPRPISQGQG